MWQQQTICEVSKKAGGQGLNLRLKASLLPIHAMSHCSLPNASHPPALPPVSFQTDQILPSLPGPECPKKRTFDSVSANHYLYP